MKTYPRVLGLVLILSFVVFCLPVFADERGMGNAETEYASIIDKEIAKYQAKVEFNNSGSANLQQEAVKASMMSAFLREYKKELIAEMKRKEIGTEDNQISNFLNQEFLDFYSAAWLGYCCVVKEPE